MDAAEFHTRAETRLRELLPFHTEAILVNPGRIGALASVTLGDFIVWLSYGRSMNPEVPPDYSAIAAVLDQKLGVPGSLTSWVYTRGVGWDRELVSGHVAAFWISYRRISHGFISPRVVRHILTCIGEPCGLEDYGFRARTADVLRALASMDHQALKSAHALGGAEALEALLQAMYGA